MGLRTSYQGLRDELLAAIQRSASSGDTRRVATLGRLIEETDRALDEATRLEGGLVSLREKLRKPTKSGNGRSGEVERDEAPVAQSVVGNKERGERKRRMFAPMHQLERTRGVRYRTTAGSLVGIATATERIPNRWFLGLPDEAFHCAVLICEHDGRDLEFVLPAECLVEIWPRLSREKKTGQVGEKKTGQVKFHVERVRGQPSEYHLRLLGGEMLDLQQYLGNFGPLAT